MRLNHITIQVNDIEKTKKFYKETLNLVPHFEKEISGELYSKVTANKDLKLKFVALKIPNTDIVLELAEFVNPKRSTNKDFGHIAFEVDNIDDLYQKLVHMNIPTLSEPVTISGQGKGLDGKKFFYFLDPDNNLIELIEKNPNLYTK